MTRRRWIADEFSGSRACLLGDNAHHLARVLRARLGQQFEIATPEGVRLGTIIEIDPECVAFSLQEVPVLDVAQQVPKVDLYLAVFKFDRYEWAIEKCAELGVAVIIPLIAQRTEAHLAKAAEKRVERWRRLVHEAAQQSRRSSVPEIKNPEKLEAATSKVAGHRIVLSENERQRQFTELLPGVGCLSLAVGPEGGWTKSEQNLFAESGWHAASLGSNILRAETAAILACGLALLLRGEHSRERRASNPLC